MIGCNLSRFCLMIGEKPVDHPLKAVQILQQKFGRKMKPVEVPAEPRSATRTSSKAIRSTSACFRRSGCGRSTAACISAPATPSSPRSGDRPRQRRHLPDDDQGSARDRRLHLARQGRDHRPRQIVEDGQADADRRGLRHRSAAVPGRRDQPAEDRERVRILLRHQRLADRAVHLGPHRAAAAGARRDHPGRPSSIRTRPSPKARSASSPAITAGPPARRPTCASSACAIATIRR